MASVIGHVDQQFLYPSETAEQAKGESIKPGRYQGESVQVIDSQTSLANLAEELGQVADRFRDKSRDKKKFGGADDYKSRRLELIKKFVKKIPDLEKNTKVREFIEYLSANGDSSSDELEEYMGNAFGDDYTHQFSALQCASQFYGGMVHSDENIKQKIVELQKKLLTDHKSEIQAGLNVSLVAEEFLTEMPESSLTTSDLRRKYWDSVRDYENLPKAYQDLKTRYDSIDLTLAVAFSLKALSVDYHTAGSSIPKERLQAIICDMSRLKVLVGIHEDCSVVESQVLRIYNIDNVGEHSLMERLLVLLEQRWVTSSDISSIADYLGLDLNDIQSNIFILKKVTDLIRAFPDEAFSSLDQKKNLLSCSQEALDAKIFQEVGGKRQNILANQDV